MSPENLGRLTENDIKGRIAALEGALPPANTAEEHQFKLISVILLTLVGDALIKLTRIADAHPGGNFHP